MLPRLHHHAGLEALCAAVADEVAGLVQEALERGGRCTVVLAGGKTPRGVYQHLAEHPEIKWADVVLVFGDERAVPPDDAHSNFLMVSEALLAPLEQRGVQPVTLRIAGELAPEEAARRYAELIAPFAPAHFDVVLLGMGDDGHVASIFPGLPEAPTPAAVVATTSPLPPAARVSLTLPRLAQTRALLMLVGGAGKAERLAEVWQAIAHGEARPEQVPAARLGLLVADGTRFEWHLDRAAGALLLKDGA